MVTAEPPHPPKHSGPAEQPRRPDTCAAPGKDTPSQGGEHSGPVGNERLTALAGAVVLVLSVIEVATVPTLRSLLDGPLLRRFAAGRPGGGQDRQHRLRFARYYTRDPAYRRKGPPRPLLRILAPLLAASTLTLIGSGIALAVTGPAPLS